MVRFAVLGAGNIAHRFARSLAHEKDAELVAASCRTHEKAQAFLGEVPHASGARAYGSHEELLADPGVDAIYLALPHALHHDWAIRALEAGKDVLCEKPAMLTADQMREAVAKPIRQLVEAITNSLASTPPDLADDILQRGIVLTGGGAILDGLEEAIESGTGVKATLAADPITAVALGTGAYLRAMTDFENAR